MNFEKKSKKLIPKNNKSRKYQLEDDFNNANIAKIISLHLIDKDCIYINLDTQENDFDCGPIILIFIRRIIKDYQEDNILSDIYFNDFKNIELVYSSIELRNRMIYYINQYIE